jgi:multiple sugar transport system substrate-binding protein
VTLSIFHIRRFAFFSLLLLLAGCLKADDESKKPVARPLEGVTVRLAVVDDAALAAAVVRVKGEWNAQTGSELEVIETTETELLQAERLPADCVLCSSCLLGVLAERKQLAPVPRKVLHNAEWAGVFSLLRLREAVWGDQPMAVPFGSPVFCCYYRADLLEKLGRRPPKTWDEYQALAKLLAKNSPRPLGEGQGVRAWCGTIEPLAPGWAGQVLLARAAAYSKHRDNFSTLFDIETMEPLVSGPPFVQALEELVAAAKLGPADRLKYDPAAVRAAFWNGQCGMALTWPSAAQEGRGERGEGKGRHTASADISDSRSSLSPLPSPLSPLRVGFVELPGSRRVFNLANHNWEQRADDEDTRVPLLTISGRLGVVDKKSDHVDAAFQLLLWLSGSDMSPQVSAASPSTTLFRKSNVASPGAWVEKPVPATAAGQYADATEATLSHEQWLGSLRMPGRAEYLAALDEAVAAAVRGEKSPLDALLDVDGNWQKITERLGLERQKAAYRHSLGLE